MALMFLTRSKNKRSNVKLSHVSPTTLAPGNLIPASFVRIVAGDKVRFNPSIFVQAFPMNAPLVNGFKICLEYFFIPDRIYNMDANLDFQGVANDPYDVKYPLLPDGSSPFLTGGVLAMSTANLSGVASYIPAPGSLADYVCFPVGSVQETDGTPSNSALKALAYIDTVLEYYVAPNCDTIPSAYVGNYDDLLTNPQQEIRWRISDMQNFIRSVKTSNDPANAFINASSSYPSYAGQYKFGSWQWLCSRQSIFQRALPAYYLEAWMKTSNYTDSNVKVEDNGDGSISFRNISTASHIQRWLDLFGAGSGRMSDALEAQFDIAQVHKSNVPLFLGADRAFLGSNVIYQTTGAGSADSPLGAFAGQAADGKSFKSRSFDFNENGYFMVMVSLVPDVIYTRGLDPMLKIKSFGDMYAPALDNIAMEPLMRQTLDFSPTLTSINYDDDNTQLHFSDSTTQISTENVSVGYVPAWSEYMQVVSRAHGRLTTDLKYWILGRDYGDPFELGADSSFQSVIALIETELQGGNITPEHVEQLTAMLYNSQRTGSVDYDPYIKANAYNDVFADTSNEAQNFVVSFSADMMANREKSKVNVATTL